MIDLLVATRAGKPTLDLSDPLFSELTGLGLTLEPRVQNDSDVDWSEGRLVLLHRTAEVGAEGEALRAWAASLPRPLVNPAPCIEWNLDRRYLLEFESEEIPTLPTLWLEGGGPADLSFQLDMVNWTAGAVAQPVMGAGSKTLVVLEATESSLPGDQAKLDGMLKEGAVFLQPLLPHLAREGVRSLVHIGGQFSHAVQRSARSDRVPRVSPEGDPRAVEAEGAEHQAASEAIAGIPGNPLWSRVDMVRDTDGEVCVVGVELIEPDLVFEYGDGSAKRLAATIQTFLA